MTRPKVWYEIWKNGAWVMSTDSEQTAQRRFTEVRTECHGAFKLYKVTDDGGRLLSYEPINACCVRW